MGGDRAEGGNREDEMQEGIWKRWTEEEYEVQVRWRKGQEDERIFQPFPGSV